MSLEAPQPSIEPPELEQEKLVPTKYVVGGVIIVAVLAVLFIATVIFLAQFPGEIKTVRDIFIIILSLVSCLFGIVIIILTVMVVRLVNMIEFEIKPVLERTNETMMMVRGTTTFMSENIVKPATTASGYAAGIRRGWKALFGDANEQLK
jgi:hypothetical protein